MANQIIMGRNAVTEAIRSGRPVEKIYIQEHAQGAAGKVLAEAKKARIPVDFVEKQVIERMAGAGKHQGVLARVAAYDYATVDDILNLAKERGEDPFVVILDDLEDPHNLGAIMRTCECVGAHGVIVSKHGGVGLTDTVAKASAGAIEYVPCAKVTNIGRTIDELKERGLWIAACDMGDQLYYQADLTGPVAMVIGNEGKGIGRLVKEKCDFTVSIPQLGKIDSLNASNAAAIIMYEIRRQRDTAK